MTDNGMKTHLARVRGLGSAKEGSHHWWMQRLTAIALIPLTLWFSISIISIIGADHGEVTQWFSSPVIAIFMKELNIRSPGLVSYSSGLVTAYNL